LPDTWVPNFAVLTKLEKCEYYNFYFWNLPNLYLQHLSASIHCLVTLHLARHHFAIIFYHFKYCFLNEWTYFFVWTYLKYVANVCCCEV
jgi:hypothetical protein